jgi:hypothetical protein
VVCRDLLYEARMGPVQLKRIDLTSASTGDVESSFRLRKSGLGNRSGTFFSPSVSILQVHS